MKRMRALDSNQFEIIVSTGTSDATKDPESHRIDRDSSGCIYISFKDSNDYTYVAKSPSPNNVRGTWTVVKLFGGTDALLGNLLVANFGPSIKIDRTNDELSFVVCEKTNHYCIYTRCRLTALGGITNANNWCKEGTRNPITQGYQQIGTIGVHTTSQLSVVEHDGNGKAMIAYGETTRGVFYLKYVWYNTLWGSPVTISSYSSYEWAPDLIWTANDICHIAWESYESNTVRYKRCYGVANSMTTSNWKKANGDAGYDNAVFHSTLRARAFSMISNSSYDIFIASHTETATTRGDRISARGALLGRFHHFRMMFSARAIIYNVLTQSTLTWKYTSGDCGTVAITGRKTWSYPNLGIKNDETPIIVYSKIYGDEKVYYKTYDGSAWSSEVEITSLTGRFPIIERRQPVSQPTMVVLFTNYSASYPIIRVNLFEGAVKQARALGERPKTDEVAVSSEKRRNSD